MALTPAIKLNFDGDLPFALDGTVTGSGENETYHLPRIKRGSTVQFRLGFPLVGSVNQFFWIAHFRQQAQASTALFDVRWRVTGQTDTDRSYIIPDPANPNTHIFINIDADEVALAPPGAGVWDLEAWRWNVVGDFAQNFSEKDRVVEGTFIITQDVTREDDSLPPGVGA